MGPNLRRDSTGSSNHHVEPATTTTHENGVMMIRFFGSHEEYDKVDAETV